MAVLYLNCAAVYSGGGGIGEIRAIVRRKRGGCRARESTASTADKRCMRRAGLCMRRAVRCMRVKMR